MSQALTAEEWLRVVPASVALHAEVLPPSNAMATQAAI
jgi:hypothetical protein